MDIFNNDVSVIGDLTLAPENKTGGFLTIDDTGVVHFRASSEVLADIGGVSPLINKGDIHVYSTEGTNLPVGNDGQLLAADSNEATGLIWQDDKSLGEAPSDGFEYVRKNDGWVLNTGGSASAGEANTASSAGSGSSVSLYYQKVGTDLQFNGVRSANVLLDISLDSATNDIVFTFDQSLISITESQISDLVHITNNNQLINGAGYITSAALTTDTLNTVTTAGNTTSNDITIGALNATSASSIIRTGSATAHSDTDLLISDSAASLSTAAVQILGGNAGASNLYFSDTDAYSAGGFQYSHSIDEMSVLVNSSKAMTINSAGKVGVGTTDPQSNLHVIGSVLAETSSGTAVVKALKDGNYSGVAADGVSGYLYYGGSGARTFRIQGNGLDVVTWDTTGNMTVGSSAVESTLFVKGDIGTADKLYVMNGAENREVFSAIDDGTQGVMRLSNGSNWGLIAKGSANAPSIGTYYNGTLSVSAFSSTEGAVSYDLAKFNFSTDTITLSGDVGVGTAPSYRFHVIDEDSAFIIKDDSGTLAIQARNQYDSADVPMSLKADSFEFVTGNVGIGLTPSDHALDVLGDIKASDRIYIGSGTSAEPALAFHGESGTSNTGLYRPAENELTVVTGGISHNFTGIDYIQGTTGARIFRQGFTAAEPMYSFGNYTGTGMFRPLGLNDLAFSTAGTEGMRIDADGNVGIGVESPEANLHIFSDTSPNTMLKVESQGYNAFIAIDRSATHRSAAMQYQTAGVFKWATGLMDSDAGNSDNFFIGQAWSGEDSAIEIDTNDNVGIGVVPTEKLDVAGTTLTENLKISNLEDSFTSTKILVQEEELGDETANYSDGDISFNNNSDSTTISVSGNEYKSEAFGNTNDARPRVSFFGAGFVTGTTYRVTYTPVLVTGASVVDLFENNVRIIANHDVSLPFSRTFTASDSYDGMDFNGSLTFSSQYFLSIKEVISASDDIRYRYLGDNAFTNYDHYANNLEFNTGSGVLSVDRNELSTLTVDLDGRYVVSSGTSGSDGQVAFFDSSGDLTGDAGLTYNSSTEALTLGGNFKVPSDFIMYSQYTNRGRIQLGSSTSSTAEAIGLYSAGSLRMTVKQGGNIGIGTGNPEKALSIDGTIQLSNSNDITWSDIGDGNTGRVAIRGSEDNDTLLFRVDNRTKMLLSPIGFTVGSSDSAQHTLDVSGVLQVRKSSAGSQADSYAFKFQYEDNTATDRGLYMYANPTGTATSFVIDDERVGELFKVNNSAIQWNNGEGKITRTGTGSPYVFDGGSVMNIYTGSTGWASLSTESKPLFLGSSGRNSQDLVIDDTGNVGIGTSNPSLPLTVNGSGEFTGIDDDTDVSLLLSAGRDARIRLDRGSDLRYSSLDFYTDATSKWSIGQDDDGTNNFYLGNGAFANKFLTISETGGLVVENSNTSILTLTRSNNTKVRVIADSNNAQLDLFDTSTVNKVRLHTSGNSYFNGGNVGIGTDSPADNLHVNGGITLLDKLTFDEDGSTTDYIERHSYALTVAHGSAIGFKVGSSSVLNIYETQIRPQTTGTIDFGKDTHKFKRGFFSSYIEADYFVTDGGTSSDFVKGDGSLDSTSYATSADISSMVNGGGTQNYIPKWSDSSTLTNGMLYDTGSRIGIGTTSPNSLLDMHSNDPSIRLTDTDGGNRVVISNTLGDFIIDKTGNEDIILKTNGNERLRVAGSGYVGIGTDTPARSLEVYNNSSAMISQFRSGSGVNSFICFANTASNGDQVRLGSTSGNLVLSTNYAERMRIDSSGNVGINNTNPTEQLDVTGDILSEGLKVSDLEWNYNSTSVLVQSEEYGDEDVSNGNFDDGDTDWSLDAGWSVSGGSASCDGTNTSYANIQQLGTTTSGVDYKITFTILATNGGAVELKGGSTYARVDTLGVGTHTLNVTADAAYIRFLAFAGATIEIDSVSVREIISTGIDVQKRELGSNAFSNAAENQWKEVTGGINYPDGKVGIGTDSPSDKLDLQDGYLRVGYTDGAQFKLIPHSSNNGYGFYDINNSTYDMWLRDGKVGIGTISPSTEFHVHQETGNAYMTLSSYDGNAIIAIDSGKDGAGEESGLLLQADGSNKWEIYKNSVDQLAIYDFTRGGVSFRMDDGGDLSLMESGGNVGIGTTTPSVELDVTGTIHQNADAGIDSYLRTNSLNRASTTALNPGILVYGNGSLSSGANYGMDLGYDDTSSKYRTRIFTSSSQHIAFGKLHNPATQSGFTELMTITDDGYVGIGTTTPSERLELNGNIEMGANNSIQSTTRTSILLDKSSDARMVFNSLYTSATTGGFEFNTGGLNKFLIAGDGNIGIGTSTPQAKLDISAGAIRLDDYQGITWASNDANVGRVKIAGSEAGDYIDLIVDNSPTNMMRLSTAGLGIGVADPDSKLHVYSGDNLLALFESTDSISEIRIKDDTKYTRLLTAGSDFKILPNNGVEMAVFEGDTGYTYFNGGNVGIGTSTPDEKLEVVGNIVSSDATNKSRLRPTDLYLQHGGAIKAWVRADGNSYFNGGNLGIGNDNPSYLLDVTGDASISETLYVKNVIGTGSSTFERAYSNNEATANNELVRLDQMNSAISGLSWQLSVIDEVDFTTSEPTSPSEGDRYINTATGTSNDTSQSVTEDYIMEWNGSSWDETIPSEGWTVWDETDDTNLTYNGADWVEFGSTTSHNNTSGLQGGTASEYYHLTEDEWTALTLDPDNIAYSNISNIFSSIQTIKNGDANLQLVLQSTDRFAGLRLQDSHDGDVLFYDGAESLWYVSDSFRANSLAVAGGVSTEFLKADGSVDANTYLTSTDITGMVDGAGTANYLAKWADANTVEDSVIYDDGTNIGIGKTNPTTKLDVSGVGRFNSMRVGDTSGAERIISTHSDSGALTLYGGTLSDPSPSRIRIKGSGYSSGGIEFTEGNALRMTILSGGNVGIGTSTPDHKLRVYNGGASITNGGQDDNALLITNTLPTGSINKNGITVANYSDTTDATDSISAGIFKVTKRASSLTSNVYGVKSSINYNATSSGTTYNSYGTKAEVSITQGSTVSISESFGFHTSLAKGTTGNVVTAYGLYVDDLSDATTSYGVYQVGGNDTNYFAGNVGIGVTSPSKALDVLGSIKTDTGTYSAILTGTSLIADNHLILKAEGSYLSLNSEGSISFNSNVDIIFSDDSSHEYMRIDTNGTYAGNVGIGTSTPYADLHIHDQNGSNLYLSGSPGTPGDDLGTISFYSAVAGQGIGASIVGTRANNYVSGNLTFNTGELGNLAERLRIDSNGHIGINNDNPEHLLDVQDVNTNVTIGDSFTGAFHGVNVSGANSALGLDGGAINHVLTSLSDGTFRIYDATNSSYRLAITSSGNVGIGTNTPTNKLSVGGNIGADSFIMNGASYDDILLGDGSTTSLSALGSGNVGGGGTTNYIPKWSAASTLTDSLIYDDGTYVGIGTSTPGFVLDVNGNMNATGISTFTRNSKVLTVNPNFGNSNQFSRIASDSGMDISIATNGSSEVIRVSSTGKVGIGTSSPTVPLNIEYSSSHVSGDLASTDSAFDIYNSLESDVAEKGSVLTFSDNYYSGSAFNKTTRAGIKGGTDQIGNTANGFLAFYTDSAGSNSLTERMRINHDGEVGIGTDYPLAKLHVDGGDVYILNDAANPRVVLGDSVSSGDWGFLQWWSSSDRLGLGTSAGEHLSIKESGYVGIGTTTPQASLDVSNAEDGVIFRRAANPTLQYIETTTGSVSNSILSTGKVFNLGTSDSESFNLLTDNSTRVTIDSDGKVGVGTTTPTDRFDIEASSSNERLMRLSHPTSPAAACSFIGFNTDGVTDDNIVTYGVQYSNTYYDVINIQRSTRNVGIGTVTPGHALDVVGNLNIRGTNNLTIGSSNSGGDFSLSSGIRGYKFANQNGDLLTITSSGDVGIGTTSPLAKLESNGTGDLPFDTGTVSNASFRASSDSTSIVMDTGVANAYGGWIQVTQDSNLASTYPLLFNPNGGNVGIGVSDPDEALELNGNFHIEDGPNSATRFIPSQHLGNSKLTVRGGNYVHYLDFQTDWNNFVYAQMKSSYNGTDTYMDFNKSDTSGAIDDTTRISTGTSYFSGNVGIGVTNSSNTLDVRGNFYMASTGGGRGEFRSNSDAPLRVRSTDGTTGIDFVDIDNSTSLYYKGSSDCMYVDGTTNLGIGKIAASSFSLDTIGAIHSETYVKATELRSQAADGNTTTLRLGRDDNSSYWVTNHAANDFRLFNSDGAGTNILLGVDGSGIDKANKVGIGKAIPAEKLDVNGYILATGYKTSSGSSSEFLKADGTVDSNTYITSAGNTQLSDEEVRDIMGATWVSGTNNTFVFDDANNLMSIDSDNNHLTSLTFNPASGMLQATVSNIFSNVTVDLDGRWIEIGDETNDLTSSVTWADVPDTNITESSVTQHEAAIEITESQISDFGDYVDIASKETITGNKTFSGACGFTGSDVTFKSVTLLNINGTTTFDLTPILNTGALTDGTYTWTFPSATGTVALTDDIPVVTQASINALNIDADTLDGNHGSEFLRSNAADFKTSGTLTFSDSVDLAIGTDGDAILHYDGDTHLKLDLDVDVDTFKIRDSSTARFIFTKSSGDFEAFGNINCSGGYYKGDDKKIIKYSDTWLRLNPSGDFSSGVYVQNKFRADGEILVGSAGSFFKVNSAGTVTSASTMTATNFVLSSDKRLKKDIQDFDYEQHIKMDVKTYELKNEHGVKRTGVIAQELEENHPEFVRTNDEGIKSVAYIDLLIAKIAELEARLEKLEK